MADLVGLPGFRNPVLGDHYPGSMGDGGEQVHFPAGHRLSRPCAPSRRRRRPGVRERARDPRRRQGGQPRVLRVRPEPAVLPLLPEALHHQQLTSFRFFRFSSCSRCCCAPCAAYAAGTAGSSARAATAAVEGSLELVRVQQFRHRVPASTPTAAPAAETAGLPSSRALPALLISSTPPPAQSPAGHSSAQPPSSTTAAEAHDGGGPAAFPAPSTYSPSSPSTPPATAPDQARCPPAGRGRSHQQAIMRNRTRFKAFLRRRVLTHVKA